MRICIWPFCVSSYLFYFVLHSGSEGESGSEDSGSGNSSGSEEESEGSDSMAEDLVPAKKKAGKVRAKEGEERMSKKRSASPADR